MRNASLASRDIVVGVQWQQFDQASRAAAGPTDLDAICELRDSNGHLLEIVCPTRLRSANDSVLHTGDARERVTRWDGERIFVFLDALPDAVKSVVFTVLSSSGDPFCDLAGASCHLTDCRFDERLLEVQLTTLGRVTVHEVARIVRSGCEWRLIAAGAEQLDGSDDRLHGGARD